MELATVEHSKVLQQFGITDAVIEEMGNQFLPLKINGLDDKAGYLAVHEARIKVKAVRIKVENTRKELKAEALEYGRTVDGEAKRIAGLLAPIEDHLKTEERAIDDAKERLLLERKAAEKEKINGRLKKLVGYGVPLESIDIDGLASLLDEGFEAELLRAKGIFDEKEAVRAEEARKKLEEDERMAKVRAEQEVEAKRLEAIAKEQSEREAKIKADAEAEAARVKAEQDEAAAKIKAQTDALEAKVKAHEAQLQKEADDKRRAEELEIATAQAAVKAKKEAEEAHAREAAEKAIQEREAFLEQERLAALRPDAEKLKEFATKISSLAANLPDVSGQARVVLSYAHTGLLELANGIITKVDELQKPKKERKKS